MPRPRKPSHLKLISGTDQPCRRERAADPDIGAHKLEDLPASPDWLNVHASKEYRRLGVIALRLGRLTDANLTAFAVLCSIAGEIIQVRAAGKSPTAYLVAQYVTLMNAFGLLSGTSAAPRKIASEPEKKSRFDRFKQPDD